MKATSGYYDAFSRALVMQFREALGPTLARVAPDWMLHHIEIRRHLSPLEPDGERVELRLIIKPIGQAREVDMDADLRTGPARITATPTHQRED